MRCFWSVWALLMFAWTVTRRSSFFALTGLNTIRSLCIPQGQSSSTFLRQLDTMIHPFLSCCSFVLVRTLSVSFYSPGNMTPPDSEWHPSPLTCGLSHTPPWPCSAAPRELVRNAEPGSFFLLMLPCTTYAKPHATRGMDLFLFLLLNQKTLPKQANIPQPFLISAKLWTIHYLCGSQKSEFQCPFNLKYLCPKS